MKNKKIVLSSILVLVLGFIAAVIFYQNNEAQKMEQMAKKNSGAPFVRSHSPKFGKNENKVIIVEFLDPECEACRAFHPAVKKIFKEYEDETQLVIRYLANHKNSKFAVRLLEAAGKQGKYNETLDVMFKYHPQWASHNNPKPQRLWDLLVEANLDMSKLRADFDSNYVDGILNLDRTDAQKLGVRGTPTFFVNGIQLKKLSYQSLLDLVESEIYK